MNNRTVLIIDDDSDFGLLLKNFFEKKKFSVVITHTLEEGMKALDEHRPEHIFLDNNLPDGTGWEQTEYILANYPDSQLNLISAYFIPKTSTLSFRIIEKPISFDDLEALFKKETFYF